MKTSKMCGGNVWEEKINKTQKHESFTKDFDNIERMWY